MLEAGHGAFKAFCILSSFAFSSSHVACLANSSEWAFLTSDSRSLVVFSLVYSRSTFFLLSATSSIPAASGSTELGLREPVRVDVIHIEAECRIVRECRDPGEPFRGFRGVPPGTFHVALCTSDFAFNRLADPGRRHLPCTP